jgi:hypothetical protein
MRLAITNALPSEDRAVRSKLLLCVLILLYMCPHTTTSAGEVRKGTWIPLGPITTEFTTPDFTTEFTAGEVRTGQLDPNRPLARKWVVSRTGGPKGWSQSSWRRARPSPAEGAVEP